MINRITIFDDTSGKGIDFTINKDGDILDYEQIDRSDMYGNGK